MYSRVFYIQPLETEEDKTELKVPSMMEGVGDSGDSSAGDSSAGDSSAGDSPVNDRIDSESFVTESLSGTRINANSIIH